MLLKDNCKPIREAFEFLDLVPLILEILRVYDIWEYFMWEVRNTLQPHQLFIPLPLITRHTSTAFY